jgi:hypothetical protein
LSFVYEQAGPHLTSGRIVRFFVLPEVISR